MSTLVDKMYPKSSADAAALTTDTADAAALTTDTVDAAALTTDTADTVINGSMTEQILEKQASERMKRFKDFKKMKKTLETTNAGKSGGICFDALLLDVKAPPPRSAGCCRLNCIVLSGAGTVIPGVRRKDTSGEYVTQCYDDELKVKEVGENMSVSLYLQNNEVPEGTSLQIVTICGVVRSDMYINAKKLIYKGELDDAPDFVYDIPKPWLMKQKQQQYKSVPFKCIPIDENAMKLTTGRCFFNCFELNSEKKCISDEGTTRILRGPFKMVTWSPTEEKNVDVAMEIWEKDGVSLLQCGIVDEKYWVQLAPQLAMNLFARGIFTVSNKDDKSMALLGNIGRDPKNFAVVAYINGLYIDLEKTLKKAAVKLTKYQVAEFFEGETMLESDYALQNPLNSTTSTLFNLSEMTGDLTRFLDREDAVFFGLGNFTKNQDKNVENFFKCEFKNIFVHLQQGPLQKKKRARCKK